MKRVLFVAAVAAFAFLGLGSRVDAVTELCPAYASPLNPLNATGDAKSATLFSYEVDALSPSVVSGQLAIETDAGWFVAPFGPVSLDEHTERFAYTGGGIEFTRKNFFSVPLYVRFDSAVVVKDEFVLSAATDDRAFPWPTSGAVACDLTSAPIRFSLPRNPFAALANSLPVSARAGEEAFGVHGALTNQPPDPASVMQARPTSLFAGLPCDKPFVYPDTISEVSRSPDMSKIEEFLNTKYTLVGVALDEKGAVTDAWTYAPSSSPDFDRSAVERARRGTYAPAFSRCRAVPSTMLFTITSLPTK